MRPEVAATLSQERVVFRMPMLLFGLFCLLHRRNVRRRDREGGFGPIVHNNDGYFAAGTVI